MDLRLGHVDEGEVVLLSEGSVSTKDSKKRNVRYQGSIDHHACISEYHPSASSLFFNHTHSTDYKKCPSLSEEAESGQEGSER